MRAPHRRGAPSVSLIRVANLHHAYKGSVALRGVTFEVRQGEILGLLGPNGGGKSTLFKILSTALLPSSGDASIAGRSIVRQPDQVRENIGVVFQSFGLDRKLTVEENLSIQGTLYGLRGDILGHRIDSLLGSFGLREYRGKRIETLSGGLQRRVEIAKGVLHKPGVLLLDEPSTGLDPGARVDLWNFLEYCRSEEQATILLTTHLADEAERCDRIAILDKGLLIAQGTPAALKAEIGTDIIIIQTRKPEQLSRKIGRHFRIKSTVVDTDVVLERKEGHRFVPLLTRAFPALVDSVTIRKPTLEDVFMHKTGRRFWKDAAHQGGLS